MFYKTPLLLVKSTCHVSLGVLGLLLCGLELAGALAFAVANPWAAQSACAAVCSGRLLMAFRWNGCCSKCANARGMMCGREQETMLVRGLLRDKEVFFVAGQKMNWREMRILTELFKLMSIGKNPFLPAFSLGDIFFIWMPLFMLLHNLIQWFDFYGIIVHIKSTFSGKYLPSPIYWCIYELSGVTSDSLFRFPVPLPHISQYEQCVNESR